MFNLLFEQRAEQLHTFGDSGGRRTYDYSYSDETPYLGFREK